MESKKTNYKEVLKSNIILFLSYGILLGFIFIVLIGMIKSTLQNIFNPFLSITLSLICGILIFHLMHFISKSSTLESFREATLDNENSKLFIKKMNLFFMLCILLSILICIGYFTVNHLLFSNAIHQAYEKYSFISVDFTNKIIHNIREEYQNSLLNKISSNLIIEFSFIVSFLSLVPYQKKLLSKYNKN